MLVAGPSCRLVIYAGQHAAFNSSPWLQAIHTVREHIAARLESLHTQMDEFVRSAHTRLSGTEEHLVQLMQRLQCQHHVGAQVCYCLDVHMGYFSARNADLSVHGSPMHPVQNRAYAASAAGAPEGFARASASGGKSQVERLKTELQEKDAALAAERLARSADVAALRSDLAEALKYREEYFRLERKCSGLRRRLQQQQPAHTAPGVTGQGSPAFAALQQTGHGSQTSSGNLCSKGSVQLLCARSRATVSGTHVPLCLSSVHAGSVRCGPALRTVQVSWRLSSQPRRQRWRS